MTSFYQSLTVNTEVSPCGLCTGFLPSGRAACSQLAGIAVLVEAEHADVTLVDDYYSLVKLHEVNEKDRTIALSEGNYFSKERK